MEFSINSYKEKKYITWNLDVAGFKQQSKFYHDLDTLFQLKSDLIYPPEANGSAYSIDLFRVSSFRELLHFITPSIMQGFNELADRDVRECNRSWANRMHCSSFGSIHTHYNPVVGENCKVFTIYLNVPKNSSDLVLIDPSSKHRHKQKITDVPVEERAHIPVHEGMCIMYDGDLPHGVSEHNSNLTRDAVIVECF